MLEDKGLNTKELIEELDKELKQLNQPVADNDEQHMDNEFDLADLENMDPLELQQKLKDANFR